MKGAYASHKQNTKIGNSYGCKRLFYFLVWTILCYLFWNKGLNNKCNQSLYQITMFRQTFRSFSRFFRSFPMAAKRLALPTAFFFLYQKAHFSIAASCASSHESLNQTISTIQKNIIRIECNGDFMGYAFCFEQGYLVCVNYQFQEGDRGNHKDYDFFLGDKKLTGKFKIIGHFQNLTVFQCNFDQKLQPLPYQFTKEALPISPVHIYMKRDFPSIRNGYFVSEDSGYGIVDGRGEIGSLILREGKILGIVTQIGRDSENGFLRILEWRHIPKILKYLKGPTVHFGVSAQALQSTYGISIVRIGPNSPFKGQMMMGDIITKVNGQKIRSVQAFQRTCIFSDGVIDIEVTRQEKPIELKVRL